MNGYGEHQLNGLVLGGSIKLCIVDLHTRGRGLIASI